MLKVLDAVMELTEPDALDILEPKVDASLSLLPIWSRQIETSRKQTEDAIVALTTRFSAIVHGSTRR